MIRACKQSGAGCEVDILNVIRIIVPLGKIKKRVVPRRVTTLPMVLTGGSSTAGADKDEVAAIAVNPADLLVGRAFERRPIRCGDVSLPRRYVNAEGP